MDVTSFSASFASEGDEKEDQEEDEEEETRMQQSLLGFYRKYNLSMLEEKEIAVSFGVRTDDASTVTCPLNDTNAGRAVDFELSAPTPMKRSISFNDVVQLNHVDSFKHELSTQEKEQCWYTDVEQVIMKIDGGAFDNTAGADTQRKKEEEEEKARQQQQHRARTGTLTKAEEKRAKEMRKKYGIDKKVKKNRSKSIEAGASSAFFATDQTRARRTQELRASAAAAEQKTQEKRAKDLRQKYQIDKKLQVQEISQSAASVTALTRSTDADATTATTSTTKKKKKKGFSSLFGKKKKK